MGGLGAKIVSHFGIVATMKKLVARKVPPLTTSKMAPGTTQFISPNAIIAPSRYETGWRDGSSFVVQVKVDVSKRIAGL